MRNLLQNKTVVASLAVVAIGCIAGNLVRWPKSGAFPVVARTSPDVTPVNPSDFPIRTPLAVERALGLWQAPIDNSPGQVRDPFSPLRPLSGAVTNATSAAVALPSLRVQAISIDGDRAFAVINRRVLSVGESIEGYVIEGIRPTTVQLSGAGGTIELPIGPAARPVQKSPSAK